MTKQMVLPFMEQFQGVRIPTTRYQGSKAKLVDWIWENIKDLSFSSALDAFGGTGVVGYYLKQKDKKAFYNDYLKSNYYTGIALIENNTVRLSEHEVEKLLTKDPKYEYRSFIAENPSIRQIESDLKLFKRHVYIHTFDNYKYVLSNSRTSEVLIIGE